ncbi:MAG: beta-N-acetylglucosaminidase domain-containing protein [bacterium]|nr:beta-N-acetylglucosaminidase domain-containing protein [bacterium]
MKKTILCLGLAFCGVLLADVLPQSMRVYPLPREVSLQGNTIYLAPKSIQVENPSTFDADAMRELKAAYSMTAPATFELKWSVNSEIPAEGYRLKLTETYATIEAADGSGFFYAVKTLKQLTASGKYQAVEIYDYPAIPFRGTVEGFYGQPWSFEARKSQFRFYGDWKMNTYIYGPKDDPYHGFSNRWRDPYPQVEAERLRALVKEATDNKVNFVWAVHPGRDIHWRDDSDIKACVAKFEYMYTLGVRSFAVFFDDIGGEGARADKQVELLNYVNRNFVRVKPDVRPLILCPTQYNKAWSGGDYLETLGKGLDSDIMIMWTGNSVCCDITKESMEWINNKIGRKAYIWWNWPVADYCRSAHLLMGRTYGLDAENAPLYSGFVSNPMDKPEASKIGLFGVADYTWNPTGFDAARSTQAWQDGIKRIAPHVAKSMQTFCNHNSDQGPNGHGYRREESVAIKPNVDAFTAALKKNEAPASDDLNRLYEEFDAIETAGAELLAKCANPLMIEDLDNWLEVFQRFGTTGKALIDYYRGNTTAEEALAIMMKMRTESEAVSKAHAALPFQKNPTEVATLVLTPFVETMAKDIYNRLWQETAGKSAPNASAKVYEFITNVDTLSNLQVIRDGIYVKLPKVHEPKTLQPGEWVGIRLPSGVNATWVHFVLDNDDAITQGRVQVSTTGGMTWTERSIVRRGTGRAGEMEVRHINPKDGINAARYINTSTQPVTITLNLFKVDVPADATANVVAAVVDGDLYSSYTLAPNTTLNIPLQGSVTETNTRVIAVGHYTTAVTADGLAIIASDESVRIYELIH